MNASLWMRKINVGFLQNTTNCKQLSMAFKEVDYVQSIIYVPIIQRLGFDYLNYTMLVSLTYREVWIARCLYVLLSRPANLHDEAI